MIIMLSINGVYQEVFTSSFTNMKDIFNNHFSTNVIDDTGEGDFHDYKIINTETHQEYSFLSYLPQGEYLVNLETV